MSRSWQMQPAQAPAPGTPPRDSQNCSRASPGKGSPGSEPTASRGLVFAEMRQQRAERLVSLLEVACLQKPVADDDETQVLREDQTPPVSPWRPKKAEPEEDSLGGMFKHLSCSRNLSSARADAELKRQVKELQRRRDAASKLIDEVEAEVMVLGEQLRERTSAENVVPESKAAAAKIGSYPEGWYLGFSQPWQDGNKHASAPSAASGVPFHYLPQWVPCGEDCAPRTDTRAIVSRSADLAAMMPAPALRCELQKNLADAHKEIADLQQEITALRREQGVNLFDGRRTDLAFTRGKHCGGQFAERVMEHFFIRTQTGAVFKAWRLKAQSCRRALRVDHLLASPGDQQLVEAFFNAWKILAAQQYANWSSRRLERAYQSLGNLALKMLTTTSLEMVRQLLLAWWMEAKMASIAKRKTELLGEGAPRDERVSLIAASERGTAAAASEASGKELLADEDHPAGKDTKKAGRKCRCGPKCCCGPASDSKKAGGKRCCVVM